MTTTPDMIDELVDRVGLDGVAKELARYCEAKALRDREQAAYWQSQGATCRKLQDELIRNCHETA